MKTNKIIIILLLSLSFSQFACQKREISTIPTKVLSVTDLAYTLQGDTAIISWVLPKGYDSLYPNINDGSSSTTLGLNKTSYKYGIVQTNYHMGLH